MARVLFHLEKAAGFCGFVAGIFRHWDIAVFLLAASVVFHQDRREIEAQ